LPATAAALPGFAIDAGAPKAAKAATSAAVAGERPAIELIEVGDTGDVVGSLKVTGAAKPKFWFGAVNP
jgi:hypothetical protein